VTFCGPACCKRTALTGVEKKKNEVSQHFSRLRARVTMLALDESGMSTLEYSIVEDYTRTVGVVIVVHHERRRATGTPCDRRLHCHTPA
jgi:hypothetical protein